MSRQDSSTVSTPEVAATLSVAAQKRNAALAEDAEDDKRTGAGCHGRKHRVAFQLEEHSDYDAEMESDGDRRNAGTAQFESASPEPMVNLSHKVNSSWLMHVPAIEERPKADVIQETSRWTGKTQSKTTHSPKTFS